MNPISSQFGSSFSSNLSVRMAEHEKEELIAAVLSSSANPVSLPVHCRREFDEVGDLHNEQIPSAITSGQDGLIGAVFNLPLNDNAPSKVSPSFRDSYSGQSLPRSPRSSLHSSLPDLSVSPLTASSFRVMEREYDKDTWRMFNRITASRAEKRVLFPDHDENAYDDISTVEPFHGLEEEGDYDYEEGTDDIFDLELE